MPWEVQRVFLAERFQGWTLEYIDALDAADLFAIYAVLEGKERALADTSGRGTVGKRNRK